MIIIDTTGNDAETNAELFYNFFNSNHESLLTDDSQLVEFNEQTAEQDRTLQATQVVDCIVIAYGERLKREKILFH